LLAIADQAGEKWPDMARRAAIKLHTGRLTEPDVGELLLDHIRDIFVALETDRITTEELLNRLADRDDGPWAGWWANDLANDRTRAPASKLARILSPNGVHSRDLRTSTDKIKKGYRREDFKDAWDRYVPLDAETNATHATSQVSAHIEDATRNSPAEEKSASD
jgi:hypothetical protein